MSLHALKQRELRKTISRLASSNQTLYTTHSPFMVGPDELDLVRVVEKSSKAAGTVVHTSITSRDPVALMPLQAALGYDLAQSLFAHQRNLIVEGLTDLWYLEATSGLLSEDVVLNKQIALISAGTASKIVYFVTILAANHLKVAALLDSDTSGDLAAKQETLVHRLGAKRILRMSDFATEVKSAEMEDLLRVTLARILKDVMSIDVTEAIVKYPNRPFVSIILEANGGKDFKYELAKHYLRWTRDHSADDLTTVERSSWKKLIDNVNAVLR